MTQQPICTDDHGTAIYKCRHSGQFVGGLDAKFTGAFIPGVKAVYVMGVNQEAKDAQKQDRAWFDEMDANCNTCKHLNRIKRKKSKYGFLHGACNIKAIAGDMQFHPHDPMDMKCWEGRLI